MQRLRSGGAHRDPPAAAGAGIWSCGSSTGRAS
jgi:hypothetical protein